jgi:hypothetical protein
MWEADIQTSGISVLSTTGLQDIWLVKSLPGTWWYYWVIEDATVVSASLEVDTTVDHNLPPEATLAPVSTTGTAPVTVTLEIEASDPEGDAVTAVWHVPGFEPWTAPVDGTLSDTFTFADPGVYEIFVEVLDDAPRYEGAGRGFRTLLRSTVGVTPPPPAPRGVATRHR